MTLALAASDGRGVRHPRISTTAGELVDHWMEVSSLVASQAVQKSAYATTAQGRRLHRRPQSRRAPGGH